MKKRFMSVLLVLAMMISLLPVAALAVQVSDFKDVKADDWFYKYVEFVASKEYFKGTATDKFSPADKMTRAMFVTVLSRVDEAQTDGNVSSFKDVPVGQWFTGAIGWAVENKITKGYDANTFGPNDPVTREQMCLFMQRFISYYSERTGKTHKTVEEQIDFKDLQGVAAEALDAIHACQKFGLIEGYEDGCFRPKNFATRAEVSAVIYRLAWMLKPDEGGQPSSGGPGPSVPVVKYHTVTYYSNGGAEPAPLSQSIKEGDSFIVADGIKRADDDDGTKYAFASWSTEENGGGVCYAPGDTVTPKENMKLYAQWYNPEDLIFAGVQKAMIMANEYISQVNELGEYDDPHVGANAKQLAPSSKIDPENTRSQKVEGSAYVTQDLVVQILEKASLIAGLLLPENESMDKGAAKEELKNIVGGIVNEFTDKTDIQLKDQTIEQIKASVKNKLVNLWPGLRECFLENGKYVCGDVSLEVGGKTFEAIAVSGSEATRKLTEEQAIEIGKTLAIEMYKDLQGQEDYSRTVKLDGTVTVIFADNTVNANFSAQTVKYPHIYPVTVELTLDGDDLVEYKFENKSNYIKLNVTKKIQNAYSQTINEAVRYVLNNNTTKEKVSNIVSPAAKKAIEKNNIVKGLGEVLNGTSYAAFDNDLTNAVDEWTAANMRTTIGGSRILPFEFFWVKSGKITCSEDNYKAEKDGRKLCDNSALYEFIQLLAGKVAEKAAEAVKEAVNKPDLEIELAKAMLMTGKSRDDCLLFAINTGMRTEIETMEDGSYKYGIAASNAEVRAYIEDLILAELLRDKTLWENDAWAEGKADKYAGEAAENVGAIEEQIDQLVLGVVNNYKSKVEKAVMLRSIEEAKELTFGNIVELLKFCKTHTDLLPAGGSYVTKLGDLIGKIPAGASVKMLGVTLSASELNSVKSATNIPELCGTIANLLNKPEFRGASLKSFSGDGQLIVVKHNGIDININLVIDIK